MRPIMDTACQTNSIGLPHFILVSCNLHPSHLRRHRTINRVADLPSLKSHALGVTHAFEVYLMLSRLWLKSHAFASTVVMFFIA